jgi:hypothetical protein
MRGGVADRYRDRQRLGEPRSVLHRHRDRLYRASNGLERLPVALPVKQ